LKGGEYGELLIMPADDRWDLTWRLKVIMNLCIGVRSKIFHFFNGKNEGGLNPTEHHEQPISHPN
jgi:hypothetical protein